MEQNIVDYKMYNYNVNITHHNAESEHTLYYDMYSTMCDICLLLQCSPAHLMESCTSQGPPGKWICALNAPVM